MLFALRASMAIYRDGDLLGFLTPNNLATCPFIYHIGSARRTFLAGQPHLPRTASLRCA